MKKIAILAGVAVIAVTTATIIAIVKKGNKDSIEEVTSENTETVVETEGKTNVSETTEDIIDVTVDTVVETEGKTNVSETTEDIIDVTVDTVVETEGKTDDIFIIMKKDSQETADYYINISHQLSDIYTSETMTPEQKCERLNRINTELSKIKII